MDDATFETMFPGLVPFKDMNIEHFYSHCKEAAVEHLGARRRGALPKKTVREYAVGKWTDTEWTD
jgi:hypothetical protein